MSHKFSTFIKKYGNVFVIIALIIIFTLLNPVFLSVYNFMNMVRQIAMVGIISVGFTFVLIGGGLDLSVGAQIAFMNVCVATMITNWGFSPIISVVVEIGRAHV